MALEQEAPTQQLIHLASPVIFDTDRKDEETVTVKGFVSVRAIDRSRDIVPPEEFRIKQFMAAPTLLVNHKFWVDRAGNEIAVGRPEELNAVKIVKSDNEDEWEVRDLKTKEIVNRFPKEKIPNLSAGDTGLFVVAVVTQPEVAEKVRQGELSAFSWRGLVKVSHQINPTTRDVEKVFTDIDMFEISLVNMPDNPYSTFVVGKRVDGEVWQDLTMSEMEMSVHIIRLDKVLFHSQGMVVEYLKAHDLSATKVRQDDEFYFCMQTDKTKFDAEKLATVKLGQGVNAIIGPLVKEEVTETTSESKSTSTDWFAELVTSPLPEGHLMPDDTTKTEEEKKAAEEEVKAADATKKKEEAAAKKEEETKTPDQTAQMTAFSEQLAGKTAEGVVTGLKPMLEALTKTVTDLGAGVTAMAEKMTGTTETEETKETEEEVASKSMDKAWETLNGLAKGLETTQEKLVDVAKSVQAISKAAPAATTRTETVETQKSVESDDDPNACLDSVFPFLPGVAG